LAGVPTIGLRDLVLSAPRLVNPHPERLIRSLDLEIAPSRNINASAYLAITVEPVISTTVLRNSPTKGGNPGAIAIARAPSTSGRSP
jgi:hypothetical protein